MCLDWVYRGQCAGAGLDADCSLALPWAAGLQRLEMFLRLLSFVAVNDFMPAMQWFQPIGDVVDSAHHLQAKILC